MDAQVALQLEGLPEHPGVYRFYDRADAVIYIGKAKNLRKRVRSYFTKNSACGKTRVLVKKIRAVRFIVVDTEYDALLLENNLIKKYQPRYNILLKDDKSYPWICIKKEPFPRVFLTRSTVRDGSEYFGPYASVKMANALLGIIRDTYPLRSCTYDLSKRHIENKKYTVCLEYHIGNCKGPCTGKQSAASYGEAIKSIRAIIKGNFGQALQQLRKQMHTHAANLDFEQAQKVKAQLITLEKYQAKSTVVNPKIHNVDVFSIATDERYGYVNFFKVANGAIIQSHTLEIKKGLDESPAALLAAAVIDIRTRFHSHARTIYLPFSIGLKIPNVQITVPKIGDKEKLVALSTRNALYYKKERLSQSRIADPERYANRLMAQLKKDLRLPRDPRHIECFDNSNIQGTHPVAACVVFINGKPAKDAYRKYHIKTVKGPDDFASMKEVVYRRYARCLHEGQPLPQLIVTDGGKGQLNAALQALEALDLRGSIALIGIAKRLEEIYFPDDPIPLYLDKKSESLKIIQQLRDEAHRFGIAFHRKLRSKKGLQSELETIPGIGEKTIVSLISHFKSIKGIKTADGRELTRVVGRAKADILKSYFADEA
ncbi:MAG: excinuclease ABC subunit UvrC [Flavobacteriales bacterium]